MRRDERRRFERVTCRSASVCITVGRRTIPALIDDLSWRGLRLHGADLPPAGTQLTMVVIAPPHELPFTGHVMWRDGGHRMIGVRTGAESDRHHHELGALLAALASEAATDRRGAALLVDDPVMTARLCGPLRRHGYLPRAVTTPLDATVYLSRTAPAVRLAIVSLRAVGLPAAEVLEFLAAEYPGVARILIRDSGTLGGTWGEDTLSIADPDSELDSLLEELDKPLEGAFA